MRVHLPAPLTPAPAATKETKPRPQGRVMRKCDCSSGASGCSCDEKPKKLMRKCACDASGASCGGCSEKKKLQRHAHGEAPERIPDEVGRAIASSGQPLDAGTRALMESRFRHDFGSVRIHADTNAAASADAVSARAYTYGHDIVFAAGAYAPSTDAGRRLLAHELTHVVQQDGGGAAMQSASAISSPTEGAELEADRAADTVMSGGTPSIGGAAPATIYRRQVAISNPHDSLEREAETLAASPEALRESRKPPARRLPLPVALAGSDGNPLPELGHDFAAVRVHDDRASHRLAASFGASAFTHGTDIFLGAGPHEPDLLAHELVHTTQDTGDVVHRRVTRRYAELQRLLAGPSVFGLLISDAQAHAALLILQPLNDQDMSDTVEAMERDHLVDNLFENVGREDRGTFETTLQRVQDNRRHVLFTLPLIGPVTIRDSCTPAQRGAIRQAGDTAMAWVDAALVDLRHFINSQALPPDDRARAVLANLERNFRTDNVFHAEMLESRLVRVRSQFNDGSIEKRCLAPTETFCTDFGTPAYANWDAHRINFCPTYFTDWSTLMQVNIILHEGMHAILPTVQPYGGAPNVTDRGYSSERVYEHLRPEEAFDNAESYARFVREHSLGPDRRSLSWRDLAAPFLGRPSSDVTANCDPATQAPAVSAAVARAERLNTDVRNTISGESPEDLARWEVFRVRRFGRVNRDRAREIVSAFRDVDEGLEWAVSTTCVTTACPSTGTVTPVARTLEVCPQFFTDPEPARIRQMYTALFMRIRGQTAAQVQPFIDLAFDIAATRPVPLPLPQANPWTVPMRPGEMLA